MSNHETDLAGGVVIQRRELPRVAAHDITTSILQAKALCGSPRVLIMGSNFVVAGSFKAEPRRPNTSPELTRTSAVPFNAERWGT